MASDWLPLFITFTTCVLFGTCYIPVKQHEIYDGLFFQWCQCSGILFIGIMFALLTEDWSGDSDMQQPRMGFYVAYEGLLCGVIWQLSNLATTAAVKNVGMGIYYTVHQFPNLLGSFLMGTWLGPKIGLPLHAPGNMILASLGVFTTLLGLIPIMFLRAVDTRCDEEQRSAHVSFITDTTTTDRGVTTSSSDPVDVVCAGPDPEPPFASAVSSGGLGGLPQLQINGMHEMSGSTWNGLATHGFRGALPAPSSNGPPIDATFPGLLGASYDPFGGGPATSQSQADCKAASEISISVSHIRSGLSEDCRASHDVEANNRASCAQDEGLRLVASQKPGYLQGLFLSVVAGMMLSNWLSPCFFWQKRMKHRGNITPLSLVFSITVGIYMSATIVLLAGATWKRYVLRQQLQRSVLRPAMLSGMFWSCALICQIYSTSHIPYALSYAITVGGALIVSSFCSVVVFKEVRGRHNLICTITSTGFVTIGILFLALAQ